MTNPRRPYRHLGQTAEQLVQLDTERWALAEVLSRTQADARSVETRAAAVERECASLESERVAETERRARIDREVSDIERECRALEMQLTAASHRILGMEAEALALEQDAHRATRELSAAHSCLNEAADRIARLDYLVRCTSEP
jgi:chromosome segregation ATPase